jgi:hypothetical protein
VRLLVPLQGEAEKLFLQLSTKYFWLGHLLGKAENEPQHPYAYNPLTLSVRDLLTNSQRLEAQIEAFLPLVVREPALAVHVADAFVRMKVCSKYV